MNNSPAAGHRREHPVSYAEYTIYVDTGEAEDRFRAFCQSLGDAIEISWKDTHDD